MGREGEVLIGWKRISEYLECARSTAVRWALVLALPVRRVGGRVEAVAGDLDVWRRGRNVRNRPKSSDSAEGLL